VDLEEVDGLAPYSYSEELPYDDTLDQHTPGVLERTAESSVLVVAALPRADSPSAGHYMAERSGRSAWTMGSDADGDMVVQPAVWPRSSGHFSPHAFNPAVARTRDLSANEIESIARNRTIPSFQTSLLAWQLSGQVG